jgi:hypothetical protein
MSEQPERRKRVHDDDNTEFEGRIDELEEGMFHLLGNIRYPGGKISEIDIQLTNLPTFVAETVVKVLNARRNKFIGVFAKPFIQVIVGVAASVAATLLVLWATGHVGVAK